ncbi:hypothetical protein QR680_003489 [Steinernema hermaphroditum]|uniref:Uncharacterized protein n=1 Tax=Steinernema hermaphroditum TaxID=289476 RepID=A0AA39HKK0_9BILA|nr:hypothetical protein QR680_003489 [Steinernema hermaphroditum]
MIRSFLWHLAVAAVTCSLCSIVSEGAPAVLRSHGLLNDKSSGTTDEESGWSSIDNWFKDTLGWKFSSNYEDVMKWQNYAMVGGTLAYILLTIITSCVLCCCCVRRQVFKGV